MGRKRTKPSHSRGTSVYRLLADLCSVCLFRVSGAYWPFIWSPPKSPHASRFSVLTGYRDGLSPVTPDPSTLIDQFQREVLCWNARYRLSQTRARVRCVLCWLSFSRHSRPHHRKSAAPWLLLGYSVSSTCSLQGPGQSRLLEPITICNKEPCLGSDSFCFRQGMEIRTRSHQGKVEKRFIVAMRERTASCIWHLEENSKLREGK